MVRLIIAILLCAPLGCRSKDTGTQDTETIVVETADTQDTGGPDLDGDGYGTAVDCDDDDAAINPGQEEVPYDGVDNDCDETTPDDDVDGDGFGIEDDCNDNDAAVNPDATEICNDRDDDCNDVIDDAVGDNWYADEDEDGYGDPDVSTQDCDGATGYVADATDCDDSDPAINPDALEVCDELDNDCDLLVDDDDPDVSDPVDWYGDLDGDGWGDPDNKVTACVGPSLFVLVADDCDDGDTEVNPDAQEVCNEIDDDCDLLVDAEDDSVTGLTTYYADGDGDGYGIPEDTVEDCEAPSGYADNPDDCNDEEPLAWPGANETCNDLDDDCDEEIDESGADDAGTWYLDADADGYGDATVWVASCEGATGYVADDTDCDDDDSAVNPGEVEVCNDLDDDCDTLVDDDDPDVSDQSTFYGDSDGDGYGDAAVALVTCDQPSETVADDTDCDDDDGAVNPGATEVCNEIDDDCDTLVDDDDPDVADQATWYLDFDGDSYGNSDFTLDACEAPDGYVDNAFDCEDAYAEANPAGTEVCDNLDNDCNGAVDDDALDVASWYTDADGDGYGDENEVTVACDAPSNAVEDATDCDDGDGAVNPGATEVCNGTDDDCDGDTDDDDSSLDTSTATTWYDDGDGDGFGDSSDATVSCDAPSATVTDDTDCDDTDAAVNPDASEVCNDIDDDCDGDTDDDDDSVDSSTANTWYDDVDGDGYGDASTSRMVCEAPDGAVTDGLDCDDLDAAVNPDAAEVCNDIDDNCDGDIDDDDPDVTDTETWYLDFDGDGYGSNAFSVAACEAPSGLVDDNTDCEDTDANINPGADEVCNDIDDDCDGDIDDADSGVTETSTWYIDHDGDGFGSEDYTTSACEVSPGWTDTSSDCDDNDGTVNPDAQEVCNEIDDDCDGDVDDDDSDVSETSTWYADGDSDGFGDPESSAESCEQPSGFISDDSDCDDASTDTHPEATEVCDSVDNDCDGAIDDDDPEVSGTSTWYADGDSDGFGDPATSTESCEQPSGFTSDDSDCDDESTDVHPEATEICDSVDNDCDGYIDDDDPDVSGPSTWYADDDFDGFGDPANSTESCEQPSGFISDDSDCDDAASDVHPEATEVCDSVDNDCDGDIDDDDPDVSDSSTWYADDDFDGFGDPANSTESCEQPSGFISDDSDCDDAASDVHPEATEVCDSVDNDCDGDIDDDDSEVSGGSTWYADLDGDGYGDPDNTTTACETPFAYVSDDLDCDDTDNSLVQCPSCLYHLDFGHSTGDGVYAIDPTGSGVAIDVYCDMTRDDGGWTLVMKQAANSGYGSTLSVIAWAGWSTPGELVNETDASVDDGNMVNAAYSDLNVQDLRLTASETWLDDASGAWQHTVNATPYDALSDDSANSVGNLGGEETTSWSAQSFTDETWTSTNTGYGLCWRSGPWFNQTSHEYTSGGVKWGWFFNNECYQYTTDTAEGLGCCGNSSWYRESPWTLYLWGR